MVTDGIVQSDIVEVKLSNGAVSIIDQIDADLIRFTWYQFGKHGTKYARVSFWVNKSTKHKSVHRIIMARIIGRELNQSEYVDHINNNGLDNRRCNLRLANASENQRNRPKQSNNSSGFKGVQWDKQKKKWKAMIRVNRQAIYLGVSDTPEGAYELYKEGALKYHGEFAKF